jgi:hypothetical protein
VGSGNYYWGAGTSVISIDTDGQVHGKVWDIFKCEGSVVGNYIGLVCEEQREGLLKYPSIQFSLGVITGNETRQIIIGDRWSTANGAPIKAEGVFGVCSPGQGGGVSHGNDHSCPGWGLGNIWITFDKPSVDEIVTLMCEKTWSRFCDFAASAPWLHEETSKAHYSIQHVLKDAYSDTT